MASTLITASSPVARVVVRDHAFATPVVRELPAPPAALGASAIW